MMMNARFKHRYDFFVPFITIKFTPPKAKQSKANRKDFVRLHLRGIFSNTPPQYFMQKALIKYLKFQTN